uniref:Cyclin-A2 n=1 Tax=Monopterus albus TaxID=43700 RepID=A0A3Q3IZU1_MONAL
MSVANGGQGNAASENHNQENMLSKRGSLKLRAAASENQENLPPKQLAGRTVLGPLQNNRRSKTQNQRGTKQETSQPLSCKNEDFGKSCYEKPSTKQPSFQIHLDDPDGATCIKKQQKMVEPVRLKCISEESHLINNAVAQLRQPLATIDIPSAMDVSFDSLMDMSVAEEEGKVPDVNEVPEYAAEIHTYLREMEVKTRPKAGYMKKQPDITNSMRAILVDWLVERGKLQLVGTAAMLLASKFEEIYPPEVAEFVYITDDTYTKKQVLKMEHLVLKVLCFDLAAPTINQFLTQYFLHQSANKQVESLAMYLGELSLVDSDPFLKYLPSQTAAAAYVLANHTVTGHSWPKSLTEITGYSLEDLMPCIKDLHQMHLSAPQHAQQSVREKYKGSKYLEVSCIDAPTTLLLN